MYSLPVVILQSFFNLDWFAVDLERPSFQVMMMMMMTTTNLLCSMNDDFIFSCGCCGVAPHFLFVLCNLEGLQGG